jgi:hypothetical protein
MTTSESSPPFEPRRPGLWALVVFLLVDLSIMWPLFSGKVLLGGDQLSAGYAFRNFFAEMVRSTGHIPQWNPYIFGGMPLWAIPGHFPVFYPTAWLRWFVSADLALTLGFFIHFVVAGAAMYALVRAFRTSWGAAVVAGVGYELTGMVASQINPGHDGKMYVAALAPLAFVALIRAIRDKRWAGYGGFALVIGLAMLSPHYQAAYYLMIASGILTLWLVFVDPERPRGRSPLVPLALALVAVLVGVGISLVEVLPVLHSIPYTPRGAGGGSVGYAYATSWAMPPAELMTAILPQFNGMLDNYWGTNSFKDHTEYVGALVILLAVLGFGAVRRRGLLSAFGTIGVLFLLVAFGGHTPFYRLWYHLPAMKQFRAAGMAFYLVALCTCVLAGFGAERVLRGRMNTLRFWITTGLIGLLAVLGVGGLLQGVTEGLADSLSRGLPDQQRNFMINQVVANATALQTGSMRLLVVILVGAVVIWLIHRRKLTGALAAVGLIVVVGGDNWSILRNFGSWTAPASQIYVGDSMTAAMKQTPLPFRDYNPASEAPSPFYQYAVYQGSNLMVFGIPQIFGYHGMESRFFDALFGEKNSWMNQLSPTLLDLYGAEYATINQPVDSTVLPGFSQTQGPVASPSMVGRSSPTGYLYQRSRASEWVRVVPAAVKVPEEQIIPTVVSPRFPLNTYVLYADTTSVQAAGPDQPTPQATAVEASLRAWSPGAMTIELHGSDTRTIYLLVAENWYPDWHATIDGKSATPLRGDEAMLSLPLPPGSHEVRLWYDVTSYHTGAWLSLVSLLLAMGAVVWGWRARRHEQPPPPRTADA